MIKGKEMPATLRRVCWNMFQSHLEFVSPKRLLEVSRRKTCADPREHIYALLRKTPPGFQASHRCDGAFKDEKPATKGSRHTKWSYGDPRLGELPEGWMVSTSITKSRTGPVRKARRYCRTATGEVVDWHPALSLSALRKRGFNFVTFKLV